MPRSRLAVLAALLALPLAPLAAGASPSPPPAFTAAMPEGWRLREADARGLRADAPGAHGPARLTVESRPALATPEAALADLVAAFAKAGYRPGARNVLEVAGHRAVGQELFGAEGKVPTRRGLLVLSATSHIVMIQWSIPEADLAALKPGLDRAVSSLRLPAWEPAASRTQALNAIVQENVNAVALAVETYAADHDGKPPAPGRLFAQLQAGGYWAPSRARANPWAPGAPRQAEALGVAGTPLAPAGRPLSHGTTLGPGQAPTSDAYTPTTYGCMLYDADPDARTFSLYGVGEADGRAVLVHAFGR